MIGETRFERVFALWVDLMGLAALVSLAVAVLAGPS